MILRSARLWLATGFLASSFPLAGQVTPTPRPAARANGPVLMTRPEPGRLDPNDLISFKLADGDIDAVLGALETYTGRTVVRPGTLPTATYSLRIGRAIPRSELVTALETILELNGVSVSPMGTRFLKVTALNQAKSEAPEMINGSSLDLPPSGKIASKIFELNFLRVSEFVPQILPFMTPGVGGGVVSLEKANVALVTDTVENIQRVERLLDEVDHPRANSLTPKFYPLHNGAKASDVATKIHTMLSGPAGNTLRATTTYTPDDRTNQIILIADPREYPLFDALISQLDVKSDPLTRMEVIPLKHGDAKDVATLLSSLISGQNAATAKANSQSVRPTNPTTPGQPPAPGAPATPATPTTAATGLGDISSSEFSGYITVQPDERTNSVVISGTVDDIRLIKGIVEKIDVLLAQVVIQVVVAEVTLSDTDNSGLQALSLQVGQNASGATALTGIGGTLSGWSFGGVTSGSLATVNPLSFLATLQSTGDKHKVRILQQDTITTTHNKQATITVTEQKPVITGSTQVPLASGTTASFSSSSTVSYKDIGITLKVTPLIGDDGSIQLTIDQTVDSDEGDVIIDSNSQPVIGHREATAFINVIDGQMAVLGGLQSSGLTTDKTKLGLLYELPIISNLLGYRTRDLERTELLLFIRPHIVRPDELTADTKKAINGLSNREQVNEFLKDPTKMPDPKDPLRAKLEN